MVSYCENLLEEDIGNFRTKDASHRVKQGQKILKDDKFLLEVCTKIRQSGFVAVQTALTGLVAGFASYTLE